MFIPNRLTSATEKRFKRLDPAIAGRKPLDFIPHCKRDCAPDHIARRVGFMSLGGSRPSATEYERIMGTNDLVDEFYLMRALLVAQPVARLSLRQPGGGGGERGSATGFMISPRLLLTNHHVFGKAEHAADAIAEFNFRDDISGNPEPSFRHRLRPERFFFAHSILDFALVSVDADPVGGGPPLSRWGWLRLIPESGKAQLKDWLTIIQHPGGRRRQFAIRENQCVDVANREFLWYLSDTAPGSSGAPVFNDSFQVAALHHSGVARRSGHQYLLRNGRKVDSLDDVDDSQVDWIANEGVRISRLCATLFAEAKEHEGHLEELRAAMQDGDVLTRAFSQPQPDETMISNPSVSAVTTGTSITVPVTLDLRLSLCGRPLSISGTVAAPENPEHRTDADIGGGGAIEAYKQPIVDTNYGSRTGFNVNFLGLKTPLPTLVKKSVAAAMKGSSKIIVPYEHFSLVMHATRRLAIYTAANVDWSKSARRPEPDRPKADYSRDGLGGFGKNDVEAWVTEPRLADEHQVPDRFYRYDDGKFDKGHLVRRDDVCWGVDYEQVRRANGDTYHMTNCSPQIESFNRSQSRGLWGLLENLIQSQGAKEKFCVYAGPVLADDDRWFEGKGANGLLRLQIPKAFWKVVVAVKNNHLEAFAFLIEQDISDLPPGVEFAPSDTWRHRMISLKDLEKKVKLIRFPKTLHNADQA